jgi:hypothetical protein
MSTPPPPEPVIDVEEMVKKKFRTETNEES